MPKYRDCTTPNGFELYAYIYMHIYMCVCVFVRVYMRNHKKLRYSE